MKCTVKKHIRRGGKKSTKNCKSMTVLGTNAASLMSKKESLLCNVKVFNTGAILLQETKARRKNKITYLPIHHTQCTHLSN